MFREQILRRRAQLGQVGSDWGDSGQSEIVLECPDDLGHHADLGQRVPVSEGLPDLRKVHPHGHKCGQHFCQGQALSD